MKYETRLMNIRQPSIGENHAAGKDGFMEGHRDARHAAALIGCEADAEIERLRMSVGRLEDALIAVDVCPNCQVRGLLDDTDEGGAKCRACAWRETNDLPTPPES